MKKTERHHWWPMCVSKHWVDDHGGITSLSPNGTELRLKPSGIGVIRDGHYIKLGKNPGEHTCLDQNFEYMYANADNNFPYIIEWLNQLTFEDRAGRQCRERFFAHQVEDTIFKNLIECITSLAIRSPMTRVSCLSLAKKFRDNISQRELHAIAALNLRDMFQRAVDSFGIRGKITVLKSPDRELIFGDGFFHNLSSPAAAPARPEILAPITPSIAVLYSIPMRCNQEPRLSTLVIDPAEAQMLNNTVQIYARNSVFFRNERPKLTPDFQSGMHNCFALPNHPIAALIHSMPGVPPRDTSLDSLMSMIMINRLERGINQ